MVSHSVKRVQLESDLHLNMAEPHCAVLTTVLLYQPVLTSLPIQPINLNV